MSMIFLGDLASPNQQLSNYFGEVLSKANTIFTSKKIICNFEGLAFDQPPLQRNEPLLYNHSSILKHMDCGDGAVLALANNHVLDYPQQFRTTIELGRNHGFHTCGAGFSEEEAEQPAVFFSGGKKIVLFNACWDFLLYNHRNPRHGVYVAKINEIKLIDKVRILRTSEPKTSIIVYLHWSLDLETLPFPLYRQLARDLIKAGAELVLGTHSHCIQGGEKFGEGYAIYGLGNFLIPNQEYAGGNLSFPELSRTELAVEWDPAKKEATCHWFDYQGKEKAHRLEYSGSEKFEESDKLKSFSPYRNMGDKEYTAYFRKHRRKKVLIPVYRDYKKIMRNRLYTKLLKMRARTAHFLATLHMVKWQN